MDFKASTLQTLARYVGPELAPEYYDAIFNPVVRTDQSIMEHTSRFIDSDIWRTLFSESDLTYQAYWHYGNLQEILERLCVFFCRHLGVEKRYWPMVEYYRETHTTATLHYEIATKDITTVTFDSVLRYGDYEVIIDHSAKNIIAGVGHEIYHLSQAIEEYQWYKCYSGSNLLTYFTSARPKDLPRAALYYLNDRVYVRADAKHLNSLQNKFYYQQLVEAEAYAFSDMIARVMPIMWPYYFQTGCPHLQC